MEATHRTSNRRGRLLVLAALVFVAGGALAARWAGRHTAEMMRTWNAGQRFDLPARMPVEEVIANLLATFDGADVVAQAPASSVRIGRIQDRKSVV